MDSSTKESNEYNFSIGRKLKVKDNGKSYRKLAADEMKVHKEKKAAKKLKKEKKKAKKEAKLLKKAQLAQQNKYLAEPTAYDSKSFLTESQKKQSAVYEVREEKRIKEGAKVSHKEKVKEMNIKLHQMSEIHDIPKCSWTK